MLCPFSSRPEEGGDCGSRAAPAPSSGGFAWRWWLPLPLVLAACGGVPPRPAQTSGEVAPQVATPAPPAKKPAQRPSAYTLKKGGGFYKDDGPGDNPPEDLAVIPDAVPRPEPLHRFANRPYSVLGRDFVPLLEIGTYKARGVASWYGRKFHGQKTSSGEPYDMYGMTAAHPILPIPSYVRVSNPANGNMVVLRVNDRGPFHADRIIDLSYTAAWKLGLTGNGSGIVEVESLLTGAGTLPAQVPVTDDPLARLAEERSEALRLERALPVPTNTEAKGVFLQLGAFGNPDNAESFKAHISRQLDWMGETVSIQSAGNVQRVQIGPYRDRLAAESAAERIRTTLGVSPSIVVR
ncbi:hypothetical protein CBW56_05475 [Denitratisoma oestradiolicum]|nr:hypothetical protein CBW56_05475 [Denitratisoma oestradiolicum]